MKAGTIIELPDGREGTVVYNGLVGYGIKWGRHDITEADIPTGLFCNVPDDYEYEPNALLRDHWDGAELECVGEEYVVVKEAP